MVFSKQRSTDHYAFANSYWNIEILILMWYLFYTVVHNVKYELSPYVVEIICIVKQLKTKLYRNIRSSHTNHWCFFPTYLCGKGFSTYVCTKMKYRNRLQVESEFLMQLSNIGPNIFDFVSENQHHTSH